MCQQVVKIHLNAGFELRYFISNSKKLEETLNRNNIDASKVVNMERQVVTDKVLGMYWDTLSDTFKFQAKFHRIPEQVLKSERVPTKREFLGIVMAIFDPFGFLADFLLFSKLLIQYCWKVRIAWDEVIPSQLHQNWYAWWDQIKNIRNFAVSRCISPNLTRSSNIQLHINVDASQRAFAAAGYLRIEHAEGVDVAFVCGKTRCAPLKLTSIPRLELCAALLGARMSKVIQQCLRVSIASVTFWSDSQTVLQWLNSATRRYKPFVGHRIAAILEISAPEQWRWVSTDLNTADLATRQEKRQS